MPFPAPRGYGPVQNMEDMARNKTQTKFTEAEDRTKTTNTGYILLRKKSIKVRTGHYTLL